MSTTAPEPAKPTPVTIELTLTYDAKAKMTLGEFASEGTKAQGIVDGLKKLGAISGTVTIGKQKFPL